MGSDRCGPFSRPGWSPLPSPTPGRCLPSLRCRDEPEQKALSRLPAILKVLLERFPLAVAKNREDLVALLLPQLERGSLYRSADGFDQPRIAMAEHGCVSERGRRFGLLTQSRHGIEHEENP